MVIFSEEYLQIWLASLIGEAKALIAIHHHVITEHKVLHGVCQLWYRLRVLIVWELIEIDELVTDDLELVRILRQLHKAFQLQGVVFVPFDLVRLQACRNS